MSTHTKGEARSSCFAVMVGKGQIAHTGMGQLPPSRAHEAEANAARLASCWNACLNLEDPESSIKEAREGLKEALRALSRNSSVIYRSDLPVISKVQQALALLGGVE